VASTFFHANGKEKKKQETQKGSEESPQVADAHATS
jgi:hypothetical protein